MAPFYRATAGAPRVTVDQDLRGSSNRQDNGLWNRESAFESLPPSYAIASTPVMGSLIKKRRKRMRKKKHKKMLKRTRWQRRAGK